MNDDMMSCLSISNCLLSCLLQVISRRHTKIRDRQIQHLKSLFEVQRPQMAPGLVETFFITREEDNNGNLCLMKLVVDLAMEVIGTKRHRTPKDTTGETE